MVTFGDLLRVPASRSSLAAERAAGADVRVVYSPRDAVEMAAAEPEREVVFAGIGFETTAPTVAAALLEARQRRIANFSVLSMHKTMPLPLQGAARPRRDPHQRLSPAGPRERGHRHRLLPVSRSRVRCRRGRRGVRGTGRAAGPAHARASARAGDRDRVHARRASGGQCRRSAAAGRGVRAGRRRLARARRHPRIGAAAARGVRRRRRRAAVPGGSGAVARAGRLPLRRGAPWRDRPGRVRSLRASLHSAGPGRRLHGEQRRGLCRPLPLPGTR